jgi:hypothetical protein
MIKRVLFLSIFSAFAFCGYAQQNSAGNIDSYPFNFGFVIGYNSNSFQIIRAANFRNNDSMRSATPISGPGFNLGLLANLKLNKVVDLRLTPVLSFADRSISYEFADPSKNIVKNVESTYIDLPISLKLKSIRQRNVRFYVIGGVKYSIDVIAQGRIDDTALDEVDKRVKVVRYNLSYEFGFGFDLYYEYFKFSPEIKIANGLSNLINHENNRFSRSIDQLFSRVFQLNFYFE